MLTILLVEDDETIGFAVERFLRQKQVQIICCGTAKQARAALTPAITLVLLDLNLPDGNGYDLCRTIKSRADIPVIFLTVRDEEQDIVRGLDMGADDYIVKPFQLSVLWSRIHAVLRRSDDNTKGTALLSCGEIRVDSSASRVWNDGQEVSLTAGEYRLLLVLLQHKNRTMTPSVLLERLWEMDGAFMEDNTLTVTMKRLREKTKTSRLHPHPARTGLPHGGRSMNAVAWFCAGVLAAVVVFLFLCARQCKRRRKRLLALTTYLEAASYGKEKALVRTEDEFSILEDELYKTVSQLRIAREQAQQDRLQQADNLADIAHQFKTPLTAMSLMTQLLITDASTEQEEYIGRIDKQLSRLAWLTRSLLTMSRLDAGVVEFSPVSLPFEELVARAVAPMEQLVQERGQLLCIDGTELPMLCDPYWTAEALGNLIKNCSEHTPRDSQITIAAISTPLYQQITIEDMGSGFDPAELPQLFRRFFRGKQSGKDSIGIGLALCRAIVEGQDGIIRAENRPEGGARFVLRFYP